MYKLVGAGLARIGQSSRGLLDAMSLDMLLDFAYGMIVEGLDPEERASIDAQLAKLDEIIDDTPKVVKELTDGRVVQISEARLARIRANQGRVSRITKGSKGGEVK